MRIIHKIFNILILLSIIAIAVSFLMKKQLPEQAEILPEIYNAPIQTENKREEFEFDYRGTTYKVIPQADYELLGLVVSHNNIGGIADMYHTSDSVDLRDACVIWGENAESGIYEEGKYKSGSWTCYWQFDSGEAWQKFHENEIANNHLISSDPDIQNQIRNIRIGDQVHITGYLVNYVNKSNDWKRETSLTRQDSGNHACEVVYVNKLEVLKSSNAMWYMMYFWGKIALIALFVTKFVTLTLQSHYEAKKMESSLTESGEA